MTLKNRVICKYRNHIHHKSCNLFHIFTQTKQMFLINRNMPEQQVKQVLHDSAFTMKHCKAGVDTIIVRRQQDRRYCILFTYMKGGLDVFFYRFIAYHDLKVPCVVVCKYEFKELIGWEMNEILLKKTQKGGFNLRFKCDSNSSCEHVERPLYRSVSWLLECVSGIQVLHQKYVFLLRLKKSDAVRRVMT